MIVEHTLLLLNRARNPRNENNHHCSNSKKKLVESNFSNPQNRLTFILLLFEIHFNPKTVHSCGFFTAPRILSLNIEWLNIVLSKYDRGKSISHSFNQHFLFYSFHSLFVKFATCFLHNKWPFRSDPNKKPFPSISFLITEEFFIRLRFFILFPPEKWKRV